jgi:hypothetical protein
MPIEGESGELDLGACDKGAKRPGKKVLRGGLGEGQINDEEYTRKEGD